MPQSNKPPAVDDWALVPNAEGADDWAAVPEEPRRGRLPAGSYQGRRGGPILNAGQSPTNAFAQAAERSVGVKRPPSEDLPHPYLDALSQAMTSTGEFMEATAKDPFTPITSIASGIEGAGKDVWSGIKRGDPRQVAAGTGTVTGVGGALEAGAEDWPGYNKYRLNEGISRMGREDMGRGAIKPGLKTAAQVGGATAGGVGGYAAFPTHPYAPVSGGALGYRVGPSLAEAIFPKSKAPVSSGGSLPSAEEFYEERGTDILRREKDQRLVDKMRAQEEKATAATRGEGGTQPDAGEFYQHRGEDLMRRGREQEALDRKARLATAMSTGEKGGVTVLPEGKPSAYKLTPEQVPGKPQLRALAKGGVREAGTELQRRGEKVLYEPSGTGYPGPRRETPPAPEARPVPPRARTAKTEVPSRAPEGVSERRVNPGLRAATGPDPVRQSLVREAQRVIDDPKSTARDKGIAKAQIADIQAHPFEGAKGEDFIKGARAGKKTMTRKQAEAETERRSQGRKKRLSEEIGNG